MSTHHTPQKVSLDRELSVVLDEALELTGHLPGSSRGRKWLAQLAVQVVCREIVERGRMFDLPLAVTLRVETAEETFARLVCLKAEEGSREP